MNNVISFKKCTSSRNCAIIKRFSNNVVSLTDWKKRPQALRTPNGVFFITSVLGCPGNAA